MKKESLELLSTSIWNLVLENAEGLLRSLNALTVIITEVLGEENASRNIPKNTPMMEEKSDVDIVTLSDDLTKTKPKKLNINGLVFDVNSWGEVFKTVSHLLYRKDSGIFLKFINDVSMNGRTRSYFSNNKNRLKVPYQISKGVFIETNLNSNNIRNIITNMLSRYDIPMIDFFVEITR